MELEDRYVVLKIKDIDNLGKQIKSQFSSMCDDINAKRIYDGKKINKRDIVVSEDWPMYEETVAKVLEYAAAQEDQQSEVSILSAKIEALQNIWDEARPWLGKNKIASDLVRDWNKAVKK